MAKMSSKLGILGMFAGVALASSSNYEMSRKKQTRKFGSNRYVAIDGSKPTNRRKK